MNSEKIFPRKLTELEKDWLNSALPLYRSGYKIYRDKIEKLFVVGNGRFGGGNYILGIPGSSTDLEAPSAPIFAVSEISYDKLNIYVSIHEELDDFIEIDILKSEDNTSNNLHLIKKWSFSNWSPGSKAPIDDSNVREIHLIKNLIILVIVPKHKKIWIYNAKDGINKFIPVSNYYNEVMRIMKNRDPKIASDPNILFTNLDEFTDNDLSQGFFLYNKDWKRVELVSSLFESFVDNKKNK